MSLKPLLKALESFPKDPKAFLPLLGRLSLEDLGFYVEDVHAMKYFEDNKYPVAHHAFLLENALNQTKFMAGMGKEEYSYFPAEWKNKITDTLGCCTLCEDQNVTLCWFVIPPGGVLPLHDHPTMSVYQRILFGKLKVTAVDWVQPEGTALKDLSDDAIFNLAKEHAKSGGEGIVVSSSIVEGTDAAVPDSALDTAIAHFTPRRGGGVLHELENVDSSRPALFIDVISPPYMQPPKDVECTYYSLTRTGSQISSHAPTNSLRGVLADVAQGDRVTLTPRKDFSGPPMNAFVRLSGD